MTPRIRILDEKTINQIAAGEVIENPASVVKELVENSIDAQATEICIEIISGGRQLIRITDDGCGMRQDDALLSLERHATSKIQQTDDINDIQTKGFRGEALPSIASISKFNLLTATGEGDGTLLIVDGGRMIQCVPAARSKGTTIEVKSLFFNTPVRKRFQKAPARDAQDVRSSVEKLALAHPEIRFELIHNEQRELLYPRTTLKDRVEQVLGRDFLAATCPIDVTREGVHIEGFLGMPSHTRPNRTGQHLFINGRSVQCAAVNFAVRDGYGTRLPAQRHPLFILFLTLPGERVDVNVHPQKREVRLRQEGQLRACIAAAVEEGFRGAAVKPMAPHSTFTVTPQFTTSSAAPLTMRATVTQQEEPLALFKDRPDAESTPPTRPPRVLALIDKYILLDPSTGDLPLQPVPYGKSASGLLVMDPTAARSRVLFDQLREAHQGAAPQSQGLLVPITLEVTAAEMEGWKIAQENFQAFGLFVEPFGKSTLAIHALPPFVSSAEAEEFVRELLSDSRENEFNSDDRFSALARRAAQRARPPQSHGEAQALVDALTRSSDPLHCPRGRPTIILINADEIGKRFVE